MYVHRDFNLCKYFAYLYKQFTTMAQKNDASSSCNIQRYILHTLSARKYVIFFGKYVHFTYNTGYPIWIGLQTDIIMGIFLGCDH